MCGAYLEELGGNTLQGIGRPLTEPVNGAAVYQAGELAKASPAPSHMLGYGNLAALLGKYKQQHNTKFHVVTGGVMHGLLIIWIVL